MSETAGTIIKIITALTSPKACVKYITVAITLFLSWVYFAPFISKKGLPDEHTALVVLLLALGAGALLGHFMGWLFQFTYNSLTEGKRKKETQEETSKNKAAAEQSKKNEQTKLLETIKIAFDYFNVDQKKLLRELTLKGQKIDVSESQNDTLISNGYIQKITRVSHSFYLVQINPIIKEFVSAHWKAERAKKVSNFINKGASSKKLLHYLNTETKLEYSDYDALILENLSVFSGCIRGQSHETEYQEGVFIWFEDYLKEEFEIQTNATYVEERFIPEKIIF